MSYHTRLRVAAAAFDNAVAIRDLIGRTSNFGDLHNQVARAAVSVASNIEEGDGQRTAKAKREYFTRARGSNKELAIQLHLLTTDQTDPIHDRVDHVGRMLTRLIQALE